MNSKLNSEHLLNKSLTKFLNNSGIKKIYPMIDNIEVYDVDMIDRIILRIHVNDPEMTYDNMYQKGLDPHYLIDYHIDKFLPYFSIPRTKKIGFVVIGPDGKTIHNYIG